MMPPAGGPPMPMRKNGGRVGKMDGGKVRSEDEYHEGKISDYKTFGSDLNRMVRGKTFGSSAQSDPGYPTLGRLKNQRTRDKVTTPERANGGRVEGGAGGGLGRLEKVKDYGKNAKSGEKR